MHGQLCCAAVQWLLVAFLSYRECCSSQVNSLSLLQDLKFKFMPRCPQTFNKLKYLCQDGELSHDTVSLTPVAVAVVKEVYQRPVSGTTLKVPAVVTTVVSGK